MNSNDCFHNLWISPLLSLREVSRCLFIASKVSRFFCLNTSNIEYSLDSEAKSDRDQLVGDDAPRLHTLDLRDTEVTDVSAGGLLETTRSTSAAQG